MLNRIALNCILMHFQCVQKYYATEVLPLIKSQFEMFNDDCDNCALKKEPQKHDGLLNCY